MRSYFVPTDKHCLQCGSHITRGKYKNGRPELIEKFRKRKYCDHTCASLHRRVAPSVPAEIRYENGHCYYSARCQCCGVLRTGVSSSPLKIPGNCRKCASKKVGLLLRKPDTQLRRDTKMLGHVWYNMVIRCSDRAAGDARRLYFDRGISVCEQWRNSKRDFIEWAMKSGYRRGLSIDRVDNSGGYSPDNCRWATCSQQAQNTRLTRFSREEIIAIRKLSAEGVSNRKIAELFNSNSGNISRIVNHKAWIITPSPCLAPESAALPSTQTEEVKVA